MLLQIAVVVLGLVGLIFRNNAWIFGGVLGLILDGYGLLSKQLRPFMPVTTYALGAIISGLATGNIWWGVLIAAIVSQTWEVVVPRLPASVQMPLVVYPPLLFFKIVSIVFPRMGVPLQERLISCPGCGAQGYADSSQDEPTSFRFQGQLEGKSVVRCLECGGGMLLSFSRGIAFGEPRQIPDGMWQEMCAYWDEHYPEHS